VKHFVYLVSQSSNAIPVADEIQFRHHCQLADSHVETKQGAVRSSSTAAHRSCGMRFVVIVDVG